MCMRPCGPVRCSSGPGTPKEATKKGIMNILSNEILEFIEVYHQNSDPGKVYEGTISALKTLLRSSASSVDKTKNWQFTWTAQYPESFSISNNNTGEVFVIRRK